MSREFPDLLNPCKAADGQRGFEGTMPLKRMQRLAPLLAPEGPVIWKDAWFRADFARDAQGFVTVELWVEAELPLICQRSLLPYPEAVRRHSLLAVVEDLTDQDLLPEHYEPVLVEQGQLALVELVEDELLLALPEVPRNPAIAEVSRSTGPAEPEKEATPQEPTRKPFAELGRLLATRAEEEQN
jgi:uncharacterized protein